MGDGDGAHRSRGKLRALWREGRVGEDEPRAMVWSPADRSLGDLQWAMSGILIEV